MKILAINPGSTSTKIGIFENENEVFSKTLRHDAAVISEFATVYDQLEFRKGIIADALKESGVEILSLDAVVGRGGLLKPIKSGTYDISGDMLEDLKSAKYGSHASNLGAALAFELASPAGKPSYIVDPVVVDEMIPAARISGHPLFARVSIFHALNQKAIAKQYAHEAGKHYNELNLIVAHMGGGISIGTHEKGNVIDVNNALGGEGPFSPERSGSLPINAVIDMCYSGDYSKKQMYEISVGKGGMVGFFGSNDFSAIMKTIEDPKTKVIIDGLILQIAKGIAAASAAVNGNVDAILLTGGLAYSQYLTDGIKERVNFISSVKVYPGEDELKALSGGALRVLSGEEASMKY